MRSVALFLVDELSRGERCVCEMTTLVAPIFDRLKHLSLLKKVGIVADRKTA